MILAYFCPPKNRSTSDNGSEDLVAQLVEQYTFNVWVLGSSPSRITQKNLSKKLLRFFLCV